MECRDVLDRLSPYLDDELDPVASREVARHLESCPTCAAAFARQQQLRETLQQGLEYRRAPDLLRARILRQAHAAVRPEAGSRGFARPWRWVSVAAIVVAVAGGAWLVTSQMLMPQSDALAREAVSSHVRSLMASHLTDVTSTDRHTVKPWFAGKLDFSPPVTDFVAAGYPLVGGRLDVLQGHPVAALVYQHRQHVINVFVWPETRDQATVAATQRGYHVVRAAYAGMAYCLVSDLNPVDLAEFARMLTGQPE